MIFGIRLPEAPRRERPPDEKWERDTVALHLACPKSGGPIEPKKPRRPAGWRVVEIEVLR